MPNGSRMLLIEATFLWGFIRIAQAVLPFRILARWIGRPNEESAKNDPQSDEHIEILQSIRWTVGAVGRNVPRKANCLTRALMARSMLKRRGLTGTVYFGMVRDQESNQLKAHAWLRSHNEMVTGGEEAEGSYKVVSKFAFGQTPDKQA